MSDSPTHLGAGCSTPCCSRNGATQLIKGETRWKCECETIQTRLKRDRIRQEGQTASSHWSGSVSGPQTLVVEEFTKFILTDTYCRYMMSEVWCHNKTGTVCMCVSVGDKDGGLFGPWRSHWSGFCPSPWWTVRNHNHQTGPAGYQGNPCCLLTICLLGTLLLTDCCFRICVVLVSAEFLLCWSHWRFCQRTKMTCRHSSIMDWPPK